MLSCTTALIAEAIKLNLIGNKIKARKQMAKAIKQTSKRKLKKAILATKNKKANATFSPSAFVYTNTRIGLR